MSCNSLVDEMENYKKKYLQENGKNSFFKKNQKLDCAKELSQSFSLESMIQRTIYNIPNTNRVIFDYTVYKLYAHPDNYNTIINGIIYIYDSVLLSYPTFEIHIILDTFSISAAERYKYAIQTFVNKCMTSNTMYSSLIDKICIYFTPSMIESISTLLRPFIDPSIHNRIVYYSKAESPERLKEIIS